MLGRGAPTLPFGGEEFGRSSVHRPCRIASRESLPLEADLTRALYEQYANQIFRYCLHQLGSREEAEDAVQSTFLNAFRGIKRGVVPELESAWLFKIAHNVCLSRRRTTWRRGRIESPTDFDVVEELAPAPSRRADELIGLQDVLEQMPENQRRAILLREWQGLSYREIAEELELSQAAVETLIFRARRALASGLEQPPEREAPGSPRGADSATSLAALKSLLLGGGAAAKVAATVAVVSATHRRRRRARPAAPRASTTPRRPARRPRVAVGAARPRRAASGEQRRRRTVDAAPGRRAPPGVRTGTLARRTAAPSLVLRQPPRRRSVPTTAARACVGPARASAARGCRPAAPAPAPPPAEPAPASAGSPNAGAGTAADEAAATTSTSHGRQGKTATPRERRNGGAGRRRRRRSPTPTTTAAGRRRPGR